MHASFNVALTKEDYVSGLGPITRELARRDPYRDRRIWEQLGAGVVLMIVLLTVFRDAAWAIFVTLIAEALLLSGLGERWVRRSLGVSYDPRTAHFTVDFSDEGIVEQNGERTRRWNWAAVRQIHDTGAVLVLELDGWDMLILPYRLWSDVQSRSAFARHAKERIAPHRFEPYRATETPAVSLEARDQLLVGAIGAGVDALFIITFLTPTPRGGAAAPVVIVGLLIGIGAAYFVYRLARHLLSQLYVHFPKTAIWLSYAFVLAAPLYILAASLEWI